MARVLDEHDLARIRIDLARRAEVFDHPEIYRSGADDALDAVYDAMCQHQPPPDGIRDPADSHML